MRTFTYWVAAHETGNQCYSLIGRTKRDVEAQVKHSGASYGPVRRRSINYTDLFDLFDILTNDLG